MRARGADWWWDHTWNPVGGCEPVSPGCTNCYAAQIAGTKTWPYANSAGVHEGVTFRKGRRRIFNGKATVAPFGHRTWMWPLEWPGASHPKLGTGKPSLVFVVDMGDLLFENQLDANIDRTVATIAASEHIGLLCTKRTARLAEYFSSRSPLIIRRWQRNIWLGFSAERQQEFDSRWVDVRPLANASWMTFVSLAPMLGPVTLPADFLALGQRTWVIVAGEQGKHADCRDMDPKWARAVRDQCGKASIPFFLKQMSRGAPIPPDLQLRQFPSV
jgi:protein gp37